MRLILFFCSFPKCRVLNMSAECEAMAHTIINFNLSFVHG